MKLSLKNIAITLGIVAGAAVAAVITTKTVKKPNAISSKRSNVKEEGLSETNNDQLESQEQDILYV